MADAIASETSYPHIVYKTYVTPDIERDLFPFHVGATAAVDGVPTSVRLFVLKGHRVSGDDLWQLAYALHHELVCHAFQQAAANGAKPRKNAWAACHWAEGWMDAVAYQIAKNWARDDYKRCLGFGGSSAIKAMSAVHDARYPDPDNSTYAQRLPRQLSEDDAWLRFHAREAMHRLGKLLGPVAGGDASLYARWFSLRLNAHPDATLERLEAIRTRLSAALFNEVRPQRASHAASVCLDFLRTGDLQALEDTLL
jgi:hypothetical protein